jgi:CheY-like chemotaxis protein
MMPEMDGLTLAAEIRQRPALAGCSLLLLSSAGEPAGAAQCQELGIARVLLKPARQSDLLDAILAALAARAADDQATAQPAAPQAVAARPRRILLADDGLVNQRVAVGLLELRGHAVTVANNGKEALAALERASFDVVLMDVQMPEMDGLEATAALRRREQTSGAHVPVIAMTAHAMKGDRERCLEAGMDGYLSKPIQPEELYQAVETITAPAVLAEPPAAAALDWAVARERVGGSLDLLQEMIELFVREHPKLLGEIRQAVAAADAPRLHRAAHTLKGSADCFAAGPTVAAAQRLEQMGRQADLAGADEALRVLEREIERLLRALAAPEQGLKTAAAGPFIPGETR